MAHYCCVPGCSNSSKKKISLRVFPKDSDRKEIWIKNINKPKWSPTVHSRICDKHFANEMWEKDRVDGKRKLKFNAVPTIFPAQTTTSQEVSIKIVQTNQQIEIGDSVSKKYLKEFNELECLKTELNSMNSMTPNSGEGSNNSRKNEAVLTEPSIASSEFKDLENEKIEALINEVATMKKEIEERDKKLELYNKIFGENLQCRKQLKKHIRQLNYKIKKMHKNENNLKPLFKKIFNDDQLEALMSPTAKCSSWSNETIKKALHLKISCGNKGYRELLNQKLPYPSERTLRRVLESIKSGEDNRWRKMAAKIEKKSQSTETTDVALKKINPMPILGNEFIDDIPTRDAFIGILREKKNTAIAIKSIANILPGFGHLKRCSDGRLLLAFLENTGTEKNDANRSFDSSEKLKNYLTNNNFNLNILENDFKIIPIPSRAPKTKLQCKKSSKTWPINFHPDPCIESIINGKFFNDKQLKIIESCMKICIDAADAASSVGNSHCNGSAVIIDPNDDESIQLLAVTASKTDEHPLWHAAMLAIDLVAKIHGGGTWQLHHQPPVIPDLSTDTRKRKYESQLPLCYPASLKNNINLSNFLNNHDFSIIKKETTKGNDDDNKNVGYLCTNYWIFLLNEPCPLCAMALLHSRVSMIFYNDVNKSRGVLGSKALLHTLPGLNHRYRVWSNALKNTKSNNNFNEN